MDHQESPEALKQRILQQLEASRSTIEEQATQVRDEYRPMAIASRSFSSHKALWIAGGVVAGLVVIKLLLPSRNNRSDISAKSAKTRGLTGLVRGVAFALAQRAVVNYIQDRVQEKIPTSVKDSLISILQREPPAK
ncbi:MAG: hypothetical protein JNJ83_04045 [Verrucomicrobiaceae bacterium]|nr:hypothetical protein [Verrucomicrobiaceae bacterium]